MNKIILILLAITVFTYSETVNFSTVSAGVSVERIDGSIDKVEVHEHIVWIKMKGDGLTANTMGSRGLISPASKIQAIFSVNPESKNLIAALLAAHNTSKPVTLWLKSYTPLDNEYNLIKGLTY